MPPELPQQVLAQELLKLDAMQAGVFQNACDGDTAAIDATLSIMKFRARLTGLYPDSKGGGVNVNVGGNPNAQPGAEETAVIEAAKREFGVRVVVSVPAQLLVDGGTFVWREGERHV